jgi:hypothetical protein
MNSGIQDADNLAWKLASIHNGEAGEELLETYHVERYAAARENLRVTEATIRFMVPPNRLRRWARAALLGLSHSLGLAQKHVNSGRMAEPHVYTCSPIVQPVDDSLLGSFAPDLPIIEEPLRLRRLLGHRFVALCFATTGGRAAELSRQARSSSCDLVVVMPEGAPAEGVPADARVVRSADTASLARYGTVGGTWWVVRPDGHLAARGAKGEDFAAALRFSAGVDRTLVKGSHA